MSDNRLRRLHESGQSIWLDYIDRAILHDGTLARYIRDEALMGMTSNPTIFEKALAEGVMYDEQIRAAAHDRTAWELFELIETDDVMTSGASLDELARTLKRAGAARVENWVVARTPAPGHRP